MKTNNFTISIPTPKCKQENADETNLRSLIYQSDGHMYTSWDKKV